MNRSTAIRQTILFFALTIGLSVVFAWLHHQTGGSIWVAIFFHWVYTYASQVISSSLGQNPLYNWLACVPYLIIAGLILALWKPDPIRRIETGGKMGAATVHTSQHSCS